MNRFDRAHRLALSLRKLLHPAPQAQSHLRAGVERPSAPMLMSISLGGPAHLRQ